MLKELPQVKTYLTAEEVRDKMLRDCLTLMLEYLHEWCEDNRAIDYSSVSVMNRPLKWFQQWITSQITNLELKEDRETALIKRREYTKKLYEKKKLEKDKLKKD